MLPLHEKAGKMPEMSLKQTSKQNQDKSRENTATKLIVMSRISPPNMECTVATSDERE